MCIHVLKITLRYLLIAEIIEMTQPAPMVNLPRSPLLGSYGISSKQAYKLSFTLVGKIQTKHLPDQPDLVICSWFANFFQQKVYSIINVLPNINSARLYLNLISTHNHCSCVSLPIHDIALSLITSLKNNSPLILFHSIYFVHYHHILLELSCKSFIYL